jgi:hypothetical protein
MPKHPLSEAQRRQRTGAAHRIEKLANNGAGADADYVLCADRPRPEYGFASLKVHTNGALTVTRGSNRVRLTAVEAAELVALATELLPKAGTGAVSPSKARMQKFPVAKQGARPFGRG